ncbi:hypothetical protein JHK87_006870 [Glycine soja]|nr:hypothetical protein JHK87_006870 [Glycine soja]
MLISGLNKNLMLYEVISVLEEDGAEVVTVNFSTVADKFFTRVAWGLAVLGNLIESKRGGYIMHFRQHYLCYIGRVWKKRLDLTGKD